MKHTENLFDWDNALIFIRAADLDLLDCGLQSLPSYMSLPSFIYYHILSYIIIYFCRISHRIILKS